jgi:hypothetical protein
LRGRLTGRTPCFELGDEGSNPSASTIFMKNIYIVIIKRKNAIEEIMGFYSSWKKAQAFAELLPHHSAVEIFVRKVPINQCYVPRDYLK